MEFCQSDFIWLVLLLLWIQYRLLSDVRDSRLLFSGVWRSVHQKSSDVSENLLPPFRGTTVLPGYTASHAKRLPSQSPPWYSEISYYVIALYLQLSLSQISARTCTVSVHFSWICTRFSGKWKQQKVVSLSKHKFWPSTASWMHWATARHSLKLSRCNNVLTRKPWSLALTLKLFLD